ncbi:FcoT family thioesterase [Streptomyces sp. NPDC006923]|uniref:FcoT family thioesterase n=1 Tax=Streptomyces sp. NPDC006923 TaxID=3155355 RepID=UPI0033D9DCFF
MTTAPLLPSGTAPAGFPTDDELLARVLRVYRPSCQYLKTATVDVTDDGLTRARCTFAIPAPFYIDDTGHFNAVEFNLCYNQMMYYAVAKSVKEGLMPPFADWSMEEYWQRQLPDFLIVDFHSSFAKGMKAHHFHGEITFTRARRYSGGRPRQPVIVANTSCRYWDDDGGHCEGEVRLVITNPPQRRPGGGAGDVA